MSDPGEEILSRLKRCRTELEKAHKEFDEEKEAVRWLYDQLFKEIEEKENKRCNPIRKRLRELEVSYQPFCKHPMWDYNDEYCHLCGIKFWDSDEED